MRRILEKFSLFTFFTATTIMSASSISAVIPIESNFYITDTQNVLNDKTKEHIISVNEFLQQQEEKPQVAVIITDNLDGADISEYAWEQFESMDLGSYNHDNGALILISTEDSQVEVEMGYGLEKMINESVMDEVLTHATRYALKDDFSSAILLIFNQLVYQIQEAYEYGDIVEAVALGDIHGGLASLLIGGLMALVLIAFYYLAICVHHFGVHVYECKKDGVDLKTAFKTFLSPTSGLGWHHPRNTRLRRINLENEEKEGE